MLLLNMQMLITMMMIMIIVPLTLKRSQTRTIAIIRLEWVRMSFCIRSARSTNRQRLLQWRTFTAKKLRFGGRTEIVDLNQT